MFDVSLFFRFLTFGILIFSCYVLMKKYGISYVKQELVNKKSFFDKLKNKKESLVQQKLFLEKEVEKEVRLSEELDKKLLLWQKMFAEEQLEHKKHLEEAQLFLDKKIESQKKQLQVLYFRKKNFPEILKNMEKQVLRDFENKEKEEEFLIETIGYIK